MLRLKELREKFKYTQEYVAENLGVSRPTYTRYESEERKLSIESLKKLALLYKTTIDYLVDNDECTPAHILAVHCRDSTEELPEEAQQQLDDYIEYLRSKYKKK